MIKCVKNVLISIVINVNCLEKIVLYAKKALSFRAVFVKTNVIRI